MKTFFSTALVLMALEERRNELLHQQAETPEWDEKNREVIAYKLEQLKKTERRLQKDMH